MSYLNWNALIFGTYSPRQVMWAVSESDWQDTRLRMIGEPLAVKYDILSRWLIHRGYSESAKIQVTNYVNALKRGGLIKV